MAAYFAGFGTMEMIVAGIFAVGCLITAVLIVKDVLIELLHPTKSSEVTEENFNRR